MGENPQEFPESLRSTTRRTSPDFPGSAGDRERAKFRPSATPGLDQVAVSGDDGRPVAKTTNELLAELLLWQKAAVVALAWLSEDFSVQDVVNEASR